MFHNYSLDKRAIPIRTIASMVETMEQKGYSAAQVLSDTGITEADLLDTDYRVTYRQRINQISNILNLVNDPGFWLDTESVVSISDFGLPGYAMMSSASLDQAVQIAVKYHKTAGAMYDVSFLQEGDDAVIRLDHFLTGGIVSKYLIEELFLGITPLIRLLSGQTFSPRQVSLNYDPVTDIARYENRFRCEVRFGQPFCEYRFDAKFLNARLTAANPDTARSCEEACRKLLNQMDIEADLVSRICHLLLSTPGEFPKLDAVAGHLSLGTRTLRRRLRELGTSYQSILDDVKKELAIEYLQTTDLSVQEISDLLGYSELTNFRRAFVKWADLSPYQYRKHKRQTE